MDYLILVGGVGVVLAAVIMGIRMLPWVRATGLDALAPPLIAICCCPFVITGLLRSGHDLHRAGSVSARAGVTTCAVEDSEARLVPFLNWLKPRLKHDTYAVTPMPSSVPLDQWCITTALLPALPIGPGSGPVKWTVSIDNVPADVRARITRHDPGVKVFAPGLVLSRNS